MSEHHAHLEVDHTTESFAYPDYSRNHEWRFPNGTIVEASAAPDFLGSEDRVDPEEAFVASLASCHMLTFLAIAARRRLVVEAYEDRAVGTLANNADGKLAVTEVILRPDVRFRDAPSAEAVAKMHHQAHEHCFLANSVVTEIRVEPV